MPTVTLKVSGEDRELWVHAAEAEGVSLSEWLRRAAATRLGQPGEKVVVAETHAFVTTPEQGGEELVEAWEPIPEEVLVELRAEWDAGGNLAQDESDRMSPGELKALTTITPSEIEQAAKARLTSGEGAGIATPTGSGQDNQVLSPDASLGVTERFVTENEVQPEGDYLTSEPVTTEVGVEEVVEATTPQGLAASTPSEAEAGEQTPEPSPIGEVEQDPSDSGLTPSAPSAPASAKKDPKTKLGTESEAGALMRQARELLTGSKDFKGPDFKPEKKPKKR